MTVTVRFFAALRELKGTDTTSVDLLPGETIRQLFERLFPDRPSPDWPGTLMYAAAQEYVEPTHVVLDGSEVAFIPPLGAGAETRGWS